MMDLVLLLIVSLFNVMYFGKAMIKSLVEDEPIAMLYVVLSVVNIMSIVGILVYLSEIAEKINTLP